MAFLRFVGLLLLLGLLACSDSSTNADAGPSGDGAASDSASDTGGSDFDAAAAADGGDAMVTSYPNENSSLGTNLDHVRDWSSQLPFVDLFRASRAWISGDDSNWDNGQQLDLDADGWVLSLAPGQIARTLMLVGIENHYPAGNYVVLYDGTGTIEYAGGATKDVGASTAGRDVVVVDNTSDLGILMNITATNPSDHLRNIRVIMPGGVCTNDAFKRCDSAADCGGATCESFESNYATQIFNPQFLDRTKRFSTLRFMDWQDTNDSPLSTWAERPKLTDIRWTTDKGVPVEIMVDLANRLHADAWFCMPHLATDNFVTQFAQLVKSTLSSDLKILIEHSNEVWNGQFGQAGYAQTQGLNMGLSTNGLEAQLRYHALRSKQIFALWHAEFAGETQRVVRVLASQAANAWTATTALDHDGTAAVTDAVAIAPYIGGYLGSPSETPSWKNGTAAALLDRVELEALPIALGWVTDYITALNPYPGIDLIAYEAGQHLVGTSGEENDAQVNALFDAVNKDPRMKSIYLQYLAGWKAAGGKLLANFIDCGVQSKWGRWGALEYIDQPRSEAPKHDALLEFIATTPKWW